MEKWKEVDSRPEGHDWCQSQSYSHVNERGYTLVEECAKCGAVLNVESDTGSAEDEKISVLLD